MRKTLIAVTAASALAFLGFSTTAFAGNGNHSHNGNAQPQHRDRWLVAAQYRRTGQRLT